MKYNVMKKWVKALRSGKYKQTNGSLADSEGFCCLGVLCEVAIKDKIDLTKVTDTDLKTVKYNGNVGCMPIVVMEYSDMKNVYGRYSNKRLSLADLNDTGRYSFKRIADVIENNWKKL